MESATLYKIERHYTFSYFFAILFTMWQLISAHNKRSILLSSNYFSASPLLNSDDWASSSPLKKVLSVVLVIVILAAIGAIVYITVMPYTGEKFTEFYILGPEGKAENYPRTVSSGEEVSVILGIVNHEYEDASYQVKIVISGNKVNEVGPITLANQAKWEEKVSFIAIELGNNQKVEYVLYKAGQDNAYLTLNLWVDVQSP